jgi:hypothetical protein
MPLHHWGKDDHAQPEHRALALWDDLRPSEAEDRSRLVENVYAQADAIEAEVVDRIGELFVGAALEFAWMHPDAPRAR